MGKKISILLCIFLAVNSITGLYGQKSGKKIKITGFVVDIESIPITNAIIIIDGEKTGNMIRGEIPGVAVNGTSIMIRSSTSINSGTEPLFVVDGVPVTTIDNIHPQMVRSIEVLKGSATSIYGTRGSNGVILINLLK